MIKVGNENSGHSAIRKREYFRVTGIGIICFGLLLLVSQVNAKSVANLDYVSNVKSERCFVLAKSGHTATLLGSSDEFPGVIRIAGYLQEDLRKVTGNKPDLLVGKVPSSGEIISNHSYINEIN